MRSLFVAVLVVAGLTACAPTRQSGKGPAVWGMPPRPTAPAPARAPAPSRPAPAPSPSAPATTVAVDAQPRGYYVPTPQEIEAAAVGPMPGNYQQLVHDYMHGRLYQPDDATFRYKRGPRKGYRPGHTRQTTLFAWSVGAYINAKNAAGKLTGEDFHLFYVVNGRIVDHVDVDADLRRFTTGPR